MNIKRFYIALYRAVSCLNEEGFDNDMENFLSDADPYIFTDRISADPALQDEFEKSLSPDIDYRNSDILYDAAYNYLKTHTSFSDRFIQISKDEWCELCKIVEHECDNENVLM